MNNTRNFTNDISNKTSFISLKNEINKKIKETLFDDNSLFLSSSFNYFCSNYKCIDLVEEGKNVSNILDNITTNNKEEINESINSNTVIISEKKVRSSHDDNESKKKPFLRRMKCRARTDLRSGSGRTSGAGSRTMRAHHRARPT